MLLAKSFWATNISLSTVSLLCLQRLSSLRLSCLASAISDVYHGAGGREVTEQVMSGAWLEMRSDTTLWYCEANTLVSVDELL